MVGFNPILASTARSTSAPIAPSSPSPTPASSGDSVQLGAQEPSRLYKLGRGFVGSFGGALCGVVGAGVGGVQHAGDQTVQLPRGVVSTAAIGGAALGLLKGVTLGLAGGPVGVALGIVVGPTIGAFLGGGLALGAATAVDAMKGSLHGARDGFKAGYNWTTDVVDRMTGRGPESKACDCSGGCQCAAPAPTPPAPAPPVEPPADLPAPSADSADPPAAEAGQEPPSDETTITPADVRTYLTEQFD